MEWAPAVRLTVYLRGADTHRHRTLASDIAHRAHRLGIAGLTTLQGIEGFGHRGEIKSTPRWAVQNRGPLTIHVVDEPARIRLLVAELGDVAHECLIVCDRVLVPAR